MISKDTVKSIVEEWLDGKEYFLVDIEISPDDRIVVEIDHADGVWIEDCVALSRYIEDHLSRDEEDYELEVGSAGLGQEKQKVEGKKRPQLVSVDRTFQMDTVKYTKYLINFK